MNWTPADTFSSGSQESLSLELFAASPEPALSGRRDMPSTKGPLRTRLRANSERSRSSSSVCPMSSLTESGKRVGTLPIVLMPLLV
jgi:hypothetical protein